jgi:hypothetical protein
VGYHFVGVSFCLSFDQWLIPLFLSLDHLTGCVCFDSHHVNLGFI